MEIPKTPTVGHGGEARLSLVKLLGFKKKLKPIGRDRELGPRLDAPCTPRFQGFYRSATIAE